MPTATAVPCRRLSRARGAAICRSALRPTARCTWTACRYGRMRTPTLRRGRAPTPSRSRQMPGRGFSAISMRDSPAGRLRTMSITCFRPLPAARRSRRLRAIRGMCRRAATTRRTVRRRRPGGRSRGRWTVLRAIPSAVRSCTRTPVATTRGAPSRATRPTAWYSHPAGSCASRRWEGPRTRSSSVRGIPIPPWRTTTASDRTQCAA